MRTALVTQETPPVSFGCSKFVLGKPGWFAWRPTDLISKQMAVAGDFQNVGVCGKAGSTVAMTCLAPPGYDGCCCEQVRS